MVPAVNEAETGGSPATADKVAMVAGSFDPVTLGHMDLVKEACRRFSRVYVTVFVNVEKRYLFSLEERLRFLREACANYPSVTVDSYGGALADYAREHGIFTVVKGYRSKEDLAYEQLQDRVNRRAFPALRTLLLPCVPEHEHISSTEVRRALAAGENLRGLVPEEILPFLEK